MVRLRSSRLFGFVIAAALLSVHVPVRAETPGNLIGRLDEAIRQVEAARDRGELLPDPGALFPDAEEVAGPGGPIRVDHTILKSEWQSIPADGNARRESLERLRHRLLAVRGEIASAGAVPRAPSLTGWRERLSQVLSRPEFKKGQPVEDWLRRVVQWLRERLGFLFPSGTTRVVSGALSGILYVLAGATLLVVSIFLVRTALPLFTRDRRASRPQASVGTARHETPESLLALADARTRAGDLRGAVQALFRWMLLGLHRSGRLEYEPALTNREHLARLRADAGILAAFERLCQQFERVWYGFHPVAPEEFATFRAECQRLAGRQI
jgi:hypothetical protein